MSSTPLAQAVQSTFAPGGPLAQAAEGFVARDGQTQLAQAVARTIGQGGVLVAEAATGVGKTFAYLVPALLSGERVLLSTATKTLQDQLFGRDLPGLVRATASARRICPSRATKPSAACASGPWSAKVDCTACCRGVVMRALWGRAPPRAAR